MSDLEQSALMVASKRTTLRKRLNEARSCLTREVRKLFGEGQFDFEGRRLIGDNGLILQWKLRHNPEQPPSYRNQQTNRGIVTFERAR